MSEANETATPARRRPSVMSLSDQAAARVRAILEAADPPAEGIRIGVKKGGCAGMEYTMDLVREPDPKDEVVQDKGVKVYVDRAAVLFLIGTRMDVEATTFREGFTFANPNQVSACGCGESVELKPAEVDGV